MKRALLAARLEAFSASFELLVTIKKFRELGGESLQDAEDQIRKYFHQTLVAILVDLTELAGGQLDPDPVATAYAKAVALAAEEMADPKALTEAADQVAVDTLDELRGLRAEVRALREGLARSREVAE